NCRSANPVTSPLRTIKISSTLITTAAPFPCSSGKWRRKAPSDSCPKNKNSAAFAALLKSWTTLAVFLLDAETVFVQQIAARRIEPDKVRPRAEFFVDGHAR